MTYPYPNYSGLYRSTYGLVFVRTDEMQRTVSVFLPTQPEDSSWGFTGVKVPLWSRKRPSDKESSFDETRNAWTDGVGIRWVKTRPLNQSAALQLKKQVVEWLGVVVRPTQWSLKRSNEVQMRLMYSPDSTVPNERLWNEMVERVERLGTGVVITDPRERYVSAAVPVSELDICDADWPDDSI